MYIIHNRSKSIFSRMMSLCSINCILMLLLNPIALAKNDLGPEDISENNSSNLESGLKTEAKVVSSRNAQMPRLIERGPHRLNSVDFNFSVRPSTAFNFSYLFGDTKFRLNTIQQFTNSSELSYLYFGPSISVELNVWRSLMLKIHINQITASGSDSNGALFYGLDASYGHGEGVSYFVYEGDRVTAEIGFNRTATRGLSIIPFQAIYSLLNQVVSLSSPQVGTYSSSLLTERTASTNETYLKTNNAFLGRFGLGTTLSNADSSTVTNGRTTNNSEASLTLSPLVNFFMSRDTRLIYQILTTRSLRNDRKDLPWTLLHSLSISRASEFSAYLGYYQSKDGDSVQQLYYLGMNYSW